MRTMKYTCRPFLLLLIIFSFFTLQTVQAADLQPVNPVQALHSIGLFRGSDRGLELERAPSRLEGAVMLVRLLGKESHVLSTHYTHPFTDVPKWGSPYIAYLYQMKLTTGTGPKTFSPAATLTLTQYSTLVLRSLGYSDGDFNWKNAPAKAVDIGMLTQNQSALLMMKPTFTREHLGELSYYGLKTLMKDSTSTLMAKLIEQDKVISASAGEQVGLYMITNTMKLQEIIQQALLVQDTSLRIPIHGYTGDVESDFKFIFKKAVAQIESITGISPLSSGAKFWVQDNTLHISISYTDSKEAFQEKQNKLAVARKKAEEVIASILRDAMSEYEKSLAIHDYIVNQTVYNTESAESGQLTFADNTYYGVLIEGKATCLGYAETMKLMGELAGLEVIVVLGDTVRDGETVGHAWNLVRINGEYYHIDPTWNDPVLSTGEQILSRDYFLITDAEIQTTHVWERAKYPSATRTSQNYYIKNNLVVQDYAGFVQKLQSEVSQRHQEISIKIINKDVHLKDLRSIITSDLGVSSYSASENTYLGIIHITQITYW